MKLNSILYLLFFIGFLHVAKAQQTLNNESRYKTYKEAYELFYKEKYAAAQ